MFILEESGVNRDGEIETFGHVPSARQMFSLLVFERLSPARVVTCKDPFCNFLLLWRDETNHFKKSTMRLFWFLVKERYDESCLNINVTTRDFIFLLLSSSLQNTFKTVWASSNRFSEFKTEKQDQRLNKQSSKQSHSSSNRGSCSGISAEESLSC